MSGVSCEILRKQAVDLLNEEFCLAEETELLKAANPEGFQLAQQLLGKKIDNALKRSHQLHQRITDLGADRELEEIDNSFCLEQIVMCHKQLVELHKKNLDNVQAIANQTGQLN